MAACNTQPSIQNVAMTLRCREFIGICDLSAFFNSIYLKLDKGVNRTLFFARKNGFCTDSPVELFASTKMQFGFRCSSEVAKISLYKSLEKFATDPELKNSYQNRRSSPVTCYIDDIFLSATNKSRLGQLVIHFTSAVEKGGFKVKFWDFIDKAAIPSKLDYLSSVNLLSATELRQLECKLSEGDNMQLLSPVERFNQESVPAGTPTEPVIHQVKTLFPPNNNEVDINPYEAHKTTFLGLRWDLTADTFSSLGRFNLYGKMRGKYRGPHLSLDTLSEYMSKFPQIKKRQFLGLVHMYFSLFWECSAVHLTLKLLFSSYIQDCPEDSWESFVPACYYTAIWQALTELMKCSDITIPRYCFPGIEFSNQNQTQSTNLEFFLFCDASTQSTAWSCYAVLYDLKDENSPPQVQLVACNSKIIGAGKNPSVPRSELRSAVSLVSWYKDVSEVKFFPKPRRIHLLSDSLCTLKLLKKSPVGLSRNLASQIDFLQENINVYEDCYHVVSQMNQSDYLSRADTTAEMLKSEAFIRGGMAGLSPAQHQVHKLKLLADDPLISAKRVYRPDLPQFVWTPKRDPQLEPIIKPFMGKRHSIKNGEYSSKTAPEIKTLCDLNFEDNSQKSVTDPSLEEMTISNNNFNYDEPNPLCDDTERSTLFKDLENSLCDNPLSNYMGPVSYTHLTLPTKA